MNHETIRNRIRKMGPGGRVVINGVIVICHEFDLYSWVANQVSALSRRMNTEEVARDVTNYFIQT